MTSTFSPLPGGKILPKMENTMSVRSGAHAVSNIPEYQPFQKPRGREEEEKPFIKTEFGSSSPPEVGTGGEGSSSPTEDRPSRKRRRSRKGLDKKFECSAEGCGKTYSRAEHLNRHKLNHTPKKLFTCDRPDCDRSFVRQDLCNRHKERHEQKSKGSLLGRKDSSMYNPSPTITAPKNARRLASPEPLFKRETSRSAQSQEQFSSPSGKTSAPFSPTSTISYTETSDTPTPTSGFFPRSNGDHNPIQRHDLPPRSTHAVADYNGLKTENLNQKSHATFTNVPQISDVGFVASPARHDAGQYGPGLNEMQSLSQASPFINNYNPTAANTQYNLSRRNAETNFQQRYYNPTPFLYDNGPSSQNIDPHYSLPPPNPNQEVAQTIADNFQEDSGINDWSSGHQYEEMSQQYMAFLSPDPLEGYDRAPNSGGGLEFLNALFEPVPNLDQVGSMAMPIGTYSYIPAQLQHHQFDPQQLLQYNFPPKTMAVETILQEKIPDQQISETKADEVFHFMNTRFNQCDEDAPGFSKVQLMEGNRSDDGHILSLKNMRLYLDCFFEQFHPQIPFLHQPTFAANKTQNLLLIAIMAIGASCLDRRHDFALSIKAAELSNFMASHLRGELFNHKDFRPPGQLWMFQALLLLEIYEKMYSTRELHERAQVFHTTTITLMRRGRQLMESHVEEARGRETTREDGDTKWWKQFIRAESTNRVAYVALLIDASHAEMFGHSPNLQVTELPLLLPCDEKIWSAPSGREAYRVYSNLKADVTTRPFLESLIKLQRGGRIETDTFGQTMLMAGLLGVLWVLRQMRRPKLGASEEIINSYDGWKAGVENAFDKWASQFDQSKSLDRPYFHKEGLFSESRAVLHHLAHMSIHVDIVECQIFACAPKIMNRWILPKERHVIVTKWEEKIGDKNVQTSVYYALQFLRSVLMPDQWMRQSQAYANESQQYRARDDPLLNRPWVLYFAALTVWCYGFAKEGPVKRKPEESRSVSFDERASSESKAIGEMREFLNKFYRPRSDDLSYLRDMDGLNQNSGLLLVLRTCFDHCRWELLKEAQELLKNCVLLNEGGLVLHEGHIINADGRRTSEIRRPSTVTSFSSELVR